MSKFHLSTIIVLILLSLILLVSSLFHSYQLVHTPDLYRKSMSVDLEMVSTFLVFVFNAINFIMMIASAIKRKTQAVLVSFLVGLASIVLLTLSFYFDAPTLFYMT